jgi:hypothetical protein
MAVKKARTKARKAAPKKAAPAKKATAAKKTSAAAKASARTKKVQAGSTYECGVCGLIVSVVDECGCVETCDLICCEESMKPKKGKAA